MLYKAFVYVEFQFSFFLSSIDSVFTLPPAGTRISRTFHRDVTTFEPITGFYRVFIFYLSPSVISKLIDFMNNRLSICLTRSSAPSRRTIISELVSFVFCLLSFVFLSFCPLSFDWAPPAGRRISGATRRAPRRVLRRAPGASAWASPPAPSMRAAVKPSRAPSLEDRRRSDHFFGSSISCSNCCQRRDDASEHFVGPR